MATHFTILGHHLLLIRPIDDLRNVCGTIKNRYGAGMDKQVLQLLGRAACVEENVWDTFEPRDTSMLATASYTVMDLRSRHEQMERFSYADDMFYPAKELGKLCEQQ